jgi:hypothetical protein
MLAVMEAVVEKKVHPHSVRLASRDGRLPAVRKGSIGFIARSDLDRWQVVGHRPKKQRSEQ